MGLALVRSARGQGARAEKVRNSSRAAAGGAARLPAVPDAPAPMRPQDRADARADAPALAALFDRTEAVLVQPSHAGNVGAAARALKVMGWRRLAVVAPRQPDFATHPEGVAFASGAHDLLAAATVHATLDAALAPATLAIAVSAAGREFVAPAIDPDEAARAALAELLAHPAHRVAFVFGTERTGLSIAQAQRCQLLTSIPTAPGYGSLNVAQAVQVVAYCVRREWARAVAPAHADKIASYADPDPAPDPAPGARHATLDRVEGLHAHLEQALVEVGFLDPAAPKRLMPRLRRLLSRTRLTEQEVDILRGVCGAMQAAARQARGGRSRS